MLKLKAPLISAGIACVLSMMIGMISGVHIISVILRGIVTGGLIGSGSALLLFLWDKFTPDIDTQQSASYSQTVGENVNITIDDADSVQNVSGTEEEGTPGTVARTNAAEPFSGETDQPVVGSSDTAVSSGDSGMADESTDSPASQEDIGELPSMDEFMPEDTAVPDTAAYDSDTSSGLTSSFSVSEIQATDADTKVMAQAIRTILQSGE